MDTNFFKPIEEEFCMTESVIQEMDLQVFIPDSMLLEFSEKLD